MPQTPLIYSDLVSAINYQVKLSKRNELQLYRIIQEALNNTVKYAEATFASVEVRHTAEYIKIEIHDNGNGFDLVEYNAKAKLSSGIKNMKERASLLRGTFQIRSNDEEGTTINISIPLLAKDI